MCQTTTEIKARVDMGYARPITRMTATNTVKIDFSQMKIHMVEKNIHVFRFTHYRASKFHFIPMQYERQTEIGINCLSSLS